MKIVICDDEHNFVLKFKGMINKYYYDIDKLQICEFNSGEAFLADFRPHRYDIVVLDKKMEGLNGLETAKEILEGTFALINPVITSTLGL